MFKTPKTRKTFPAMDSDDPPPMKRGRTSEDFLMFCKMILDYENYEETREETLRRRHASSPMGSTGSGDSVRSGEEDAGESPRNKGSDIDTGKILKFFVSMFVIFHKGINFLICRVQHIIWSIVVKYLLGSCHRFFETTVALNLRLSLQKNFMTRCEFVLPRSATLQINIVNTNCYIKSMYSTKMEEGCCFRLRIQDSDLVDLLRHSIGDLCILSRMKLGTIQRRVILE